jgi:hypothetical protein
MASMKPNTTRRSPRDGKAPMADISRRTERLERLEEMPTPRLDRLVRSGVLSDVLQLQAAALLARRKDRR